MSFGEASRPPGVRRRMRGSRMNTRYSMLVGTLLLLTGCVGAEDKKTDLPDEQAPTEERALELSHAELSEKTIATVKSASEGLAFEDLTVLVNDKAYAFGAAADFEMRRYQVDGKFDAADLVENGDRITILMSGLANVVFKDKATGGVLFAYETNVLDNTKPAAPVNLDPADDATGVSRMPMFKWTPVKDVSGIEYELQYSLDPAFQAPLQTVLVEDITAPQMGVEGGHELMPGQTYYWHVRAVDGTGNVGPWSQAFSFTTAGAAQDLLP